MKRILPIIIFVSSIVRINAQVVFCPKGAHWNYSFVNIPAWFGVYNYINEQITYTQDTVITGDSAKILTHRFYYKSCYNVSSWSGKSTFIKQKGDTIYFSNARTQNQWHVLYNFAVSQGSGWQSSILQADGTSSYYNYSVDSVRYVQHNGHNLKRLYLNDGSYVTERYGSSGFLFNFYSNAGGCDGYYLSDFLCYTDNTFGQYQFGTKPCNYSGQVNMNGLVSNHFENKFQISPNPIENNLVVNVDIDFQIQSELIVRDITGKEILKFYDLKDYNNFDLSHLSPGLYFIELKNQAASWSSKLVKQ